MMMKTKQVAMDTMKVMECAASCQFLWSGVFEAMVIFFILLGFVTYSALPGLGAFLLVLPLQYRCGLWIAYKKKEVNVHSTKRTLLMEEILRSIKLIKMYAWEESFSEKLMKFREEEMKVLHTQKWGKVILTSSVFWMPPLFVLVIFGVYQIEQPVNSALAFTTLSLFNMLRLPLVKLPKALRDLTDALIALERIEGFLAEPELSDKGVVHHEGVRSNGIKMVNCCFAHAVDAPKAYLTNVNLNIAPGALAMVAGTVGSGKTSLLRAVLGQMHTVSGHEDTGNSFAYVPQVPWCALGTVRDNILFGKPYEKDFYDRVVHACSLETDFKLFNNGDLTWIGERGGNLSGGQKQRIALARAAYSRASVQVLDSPLSAVDMHTCQHIVKYCIQGIMLANNSTVVLSTHQTELFALADVVLVMEHANLVYNGGYNPNALQKFFPHAKFGPAQQREVAPYIPLQGQNLPAGATKGISADVVFADAKKPAEKPAESASVAVGLPKTSRGSQILVNDPAASGAKGYVELFWRFGWWNVLLMIPVFLVTQMTRTWSDVWIQRWTGKTIQEEYATPWWYYGCYVAYVATFEFLMIIRGWLFLSSGLKGTRAIHAETFASVMRAPMHFFNLTPLGKTLNFFAKDMDTMDDVLLDNIHYSQIYLFLLYVTIFILIRSVNMYAVVVGVLFIVFIFVFMYYMRSSKAIKLAMGTGASNIVAHTAESLSGLPVVRAYNAEVRFRQNNVDFQNMYCRSALSLNDCNLWLAFRVDLIGCILVGASVFLAILSEEIGGGSVTAAGAGLMVSNSLQILLFFTATLQMVGDINAQISSVDRAVDLQREEAERDVPKSEKTMAPKNWPSGGSIKFSGVVMPYVPNAPPVLKGCSFEFKPAEKIGVVGRTGAGKSTLIMAMFRLAELTEGDIHIDGLDVQTITKQQLRSKIAIIPQEPVMFEGTLRSNLDPFHKFPDSELVRVLEQCLLGDLVQEHEKDFGLSAKVEVFGKNFSLGQQQLLCLARAMLTPSKLLLLDEATAALDSDTDAKVQQVLRTSFTDRTIMTIAHRLDTIIDSDRILAMDKGVVAEFDAPLTLLNNPKSIFSELCRNTGEEQYQNLRNKAAEAAGLRPSASHAANHAARNMSYAPAPQTQPQAQGYGMQYPTQFSMAQPYPSNYGMPAGGMPGYAPTFGNA
jgi:ATP-binding cassette subfamily C (CFTR/MRP) protein 1